jgi:hypothetical protein
VVPGRPTFSGTGGDRRLQCAHRWWRRPLLHLRCISTKSTTRKAFPQSCPRRPSAPSCAWMAEASNCSSSLLEVECPSIPSSPPSTAVNALPHSMSSWRKKAKGCWEKRNKLKIKNTTYGPPCQWHQPIIPVVVGTFPVSQTWSRFGIDRDSRVQSVHFRDSKFRV